MAERKEFIEYTKTQKRRNTFYCYCTQELIQDQAVFFVLVEAYRASRRKRQALFLKDWFIDGNIPDELQQRGYLGIVNISSELKGTISTATGAAVAAIGQNFAAKQAKHGGGVAGFFGALGQKIAGPGMSGDLFNKAQDQVVAMLDEGNKHGFGAKDGAGATYKPDGIYQPRGTFANQLIAFRKHLKTAGFDADSLGIY